MRRELTSAAFVLAMLATGCGGNSGVDTDVAEQSTAGSSAADGLSCSAGLRVSVINDYAAPPDPHGAEPEAAVQAYFGDGLPEDATLTADGTEVTVMLDDDAVAAVDVFEVSGGYAVVNYEACEGALRPK